MKKISRKMIRTGSVEVYGVEWKYRFLRDEIDSIEPEAFDYLTNEAQDHIARLIYQHDEDCADGGLV